MKKIKFLLKNQEIKIKFLISQGKNLDKTSAKNIFFFTPEAAVHPHFHACCYLGRLLQSEQINVFFARCWNLFEKCIVKQSHRINNTTSYADVFETCYSCAKNSLFTQKKYNLKFLNLESYYTKEIKNILDFEYSQIERMVNDRVLSNYFYLNIPFGTLCEYEVQLANKALKLNYEDKKLIMDWTCLLKTVVKTYVILKNLFYTENIKNLVYFNDYAVNLAARFAMDANFGKSTMVTHAYNQGVDRRKIVFFKDISFKKIFTDCIEWKRWKSRPLTKKNVIDITDDAIARFRGQSAHTYSPPFEGLQQQKPNQESKKNIVIFTSSPDESACFKVTSALGIDIPPQIFTFGTSFQNCQEIWLSELLKFAEKNKNFNFTVRIHPREGSNKREQGESEHLQILKRLLVKPPPNFSVFWPESNVSSYSLGLGADLVLTSWSTIGIEMARLGIPVLTCTKGTAGFPVENFIRFEKNPTSYFNYISKPSNYRTSISNIRDAYRWWYFNYLSSAIDISDVIPSSLFSKLPEFKKTKNTKLIKKAVFFNFDVRKINYAQTKTKLNNIEYKERQSLTKSIERLILFFLTGNDKNRFVKVCQVKNKSQLLKMRKKYKTKPHKEKLYFCRFLNKIIFIYKDNLQIVQSPCLVNLSKFIKFSNL